MMQPNSYAVIIYIFFWIVRINGCIRRGRQPLLRGPEWFFNVHVGSGFYGGAGKKLLHRYWMRMLIPFVVDIPIAVTIFLSGQLVLLNWLILGLCVLIHINHAYSVALAERQARSFAIQEGELRTASMALSLTPRRLRDYTNPKLEWAIGAALAIALLWLLRVYNAAPQHRDWRLVFGFPAFFLYLQIGLLFVKSLIVKWRTPVPQSQIVEHMELREETRKFYLRVCDWYRAAAAASMLFWPIRMGASGVDAGRVVGVWIGAWFVLSVVATIWVEIKRKQLARMAVRTRPVELPDLLHQSEIARWPVCYQPSAPMLMLKGPNGYSLNLGNALAYVGAVYLTGLVALIAALSIRH